jgi:hypothetical protein
MALRAANSGQNAASRSCEISNLACVFNVADRAGTRNGTPSVSEGTIISKRHSFVITALSKRFRFEITNPAR